jgi:hypothetical protein
MIRLLSLLSGACWIGAFVLIINDEANTGPILVLILIAAVLTLILAIRRIYLRARGFVTDARAFMSGDIQSARLVSVEEPRGIFSPSSEVTVELMGEDGNVHSFQHDMPVPFPAAWGYRLGKRFNLPLLRSLNPTELMAAELRREGMSVSVGRPSAAAEPAQAP